MFEWFVVVRAMNAVEIRQNAWIHKLSVANTTADSDVESC